MLAALELTMNNTYQILINWDKGNAFAERMAGKILGIEGYTDIDPQCPVGGPDGTKDILCLRERRKYVVGCYFPNGQMPFAKIEEKFSGDYEGLAKHSADGFVFVTNQKLTPGERVALTAKYPNSEIFHGERVCGVLDSPKGYGVRLEYLGIELNKSEQISFLNSHLDLKEHFEEIKTSLESIKRTTVRLAGMIDPRDVGDGSPLSVLPVAGVQLSARMSVEDLQAIQIACLYESGIGNSAASLGFRKMQVWIGIPGCTLETADFVPPPPNEIPRRINKLLNWWREEYMNILYADRQEKVLAIAQFHEQFLSIHPFLDGNGRVSRVIASIQCEDLLGQKLSFEEIADRNEYYKALQSAREGGHQALVDMFLSLAK